MASIKRTGITDKGKDLIVREITGITELTFTKISSSSNKLADSVNLEKLIDIDGIKQTANISKVEKIGTSQIKVTATFNNSGLMEGYSMESLGIYAKDTTGLEVLFAITVADTADFMPATNGVNLSTVTVELLFTLSNTDKVSLSVNAAALVTVGMFDAFKLEVDKDYVKYTDVATETKGGIARIHSLDTVENQSNEFQNMVAKNLQSQISDFIKTLNNDEILTAKSLVKYLSKLLKPATENTFGLIDFQTIKQVSPKPDLSPYIPFSKGYKNNNNADWVIRANNADLWTPQNLYMFDGAGNYVGCYHLNGGRAYYKVPNRNGGGWNEIMDNHDMAVRDNRMNSMDADRGNLWGRANNAWDKANDAQVNRIYEIRLAGYITLPFKQIPTERNGYVVTGIWNDDNDIDDRDFIQMRILQFHRNGQWLNAYFA